MTSSMVTIILRSCSPGAQVSIVVLSSADVGGESAAHEDAPPGTGAVVEHVDLEHHRLLNGLVGVAPGCGAKRDHAVHEPEVDRDHRRVVALDDESTDVLGRQQRQAGRSVELEQLGTPDVVHHWTPTYPTTTPGRRRGSGGR